MDFYTRNNTMNYTFSPDPNDFWTQRIRQVMDRMIPLQLSILKDEAPDTEPSHAIENFRIAAGLATGEFYGYVFQDSDVGKWIESASYSLMIRPDEVLEKEIDALVDLIEKAQLPDGYLNTYFTVKEPGKRWTNLEECHELYCAGHLMEGAAAYFEATGKRKFLDIMCRMADHIDTVIGPEEGKIHGLPGHPEVEIGLLRLYRTTGNEKYLKLAEYFINERGKEPNFFDLERQQRNGAEHFKGFHMNKKTYMQAHKPIREQEEAVGHSVRAMYLYTAAAQIAKETEDDTLKAAVFRLWDNIVNKKMYITGGFGATTWGEAFMRNYELPNDTAYAETCASVGAMFFGQRMLKLKRDGKTADIMEQVLYNGLLSGMSLEADRFFYVNPLEVVQALAGKENEYEHVLGTRPKWFACACCPPNLSRLITSLPSYAYEEAEDGVVIHQYLGGSVSTNKADFSLKTSYPWEGSLCWKVSAKEAFSLFVRIPGWTEKWGAFLDGKEIRKLPEDGYLQLDISEGTHELMLDLTLRPRRFYAHPKIRANAGCAAFMYGPLVYCFEGVDNPEPLAELRVSDGLPVMKAFDETLLHGVKPMEIQGKRYKMAGDSLYSETRPEAENVTLQAIPYYAWANREAKDMRVWMTEE